MAALRTLIRMIAAACIGMALLFIAVQGWFALLVWWYADHAPRETAFMAYRMGELHDKKARRDVALPVGPAKKISRNLKRALIAAEDSKFVEHEGFDWDGIQLALEKNRSKGRTVAGGSTITQQLAKICSCRRRKLSAQRGRGSDHHADAGKHARQGAHPELYLNVIEWGNGVFGAEAAARYYGVSAAQLSAETGCQARCDGAESAGFYERNLGAPGLRKDRHHPRTDAASRVAGRRISVMFAPTILSIASRHSSPWTFPSMPWKLSKRVACCKQRERG